MELNVAPINVNSFEMGKISDKKEICTFFGNFSIFTIIITIVKNHLVKLRFNPCDAFLFDSTQESSQLEDLCMTQLFMGHNHPNTNAV